MRASSLRAGVGVVACLALGGSPGRAQQPGPDDLSTPVEVVTGALTDGTVYTLVKPDAWNGTAFFDLDSTGLFRDYADWLYAQGIAIAGNTRVHVGSLVDHGAANLVETLDVFSERFGAPARPLISGTSLGGQVAAIAAFTYPTRFDGAVAFCGGLMGWAPYLNTNLDVAFTLRTLLAPDEPLPLVHIPEDTAALDERWERLIEDAQRTPEGRARIALAVALGQAPFWATGDAPEPALDDHQGRQEAAYRTLLNFSRQFTGLRRRLEQPAGGATSWNTGVSYTDIFRRLVTDADRRTVEALYREAGVSLAADLSELAAAPRIAPEAGPIAFVRGLYPFDGRIAIPVMTTSTTGDPVVWSAIESAYHAAVAEAGRSSLLRGAYVRSAGHCNFTGAERVATYQALLERLDAGSWPDTSPSAMNARAATVGLGEARFRDYTPPAIARGALAP